MQKLRMLLAVAALATAINFVPTSSNAHETGGGGGPTPTCDEFITGGGWANGDDGLRSPYTLWASYKDGELAGQLNAVLLSTINPVNGQTLQAPRRYHVQSQELTLYEIAYGPNGEVVRRLHFDATYNGSSTINGQELEVRVQIVDVAEPGTEDYIDIQFLVNGNIRYHATTTLGTDVGGGNFQLHQSNCEEAPQP